MGKNCGLTGTKGMTAEDTTIKIKIENRSPLLVYLRSGKSGEHSVRDTDAIRRERLYIMGATKDMGIDNDSIIQDYIQALADLEEGKGGLGRIPIRDVLSASAEQIGKDFIRSNIIK